MDKFCLALQKREIDGIILSTSGGATGILLGLPLETAVAISPVDDASTVDSTTVEGDAPPGDAPTSRAAKHRRSGVACLTFVDAIVVGRDLVRLIACNDVLALSWVR